MKPLSHNQQQNCSEYSSWWDFDSPAAQKRCGQSLQIHRYSVTASRQLRSPLSLNIFWHVTLQQVYRYFSLK